MKFIKKIKEFGKRKYPHLALIALLFAVSITSGGSLPDEVALHRDKDGIVDRYGSKYELMFTLPIVSIIVFAIGLYAEKRHVPPRTRVKGIMAFFQFFFVLLIFVFQLYGLFRAMNFAVELESLSSVLFSALFAYMGYIIKYSDYMSSFGIKTKWTIADPSVWEKTSKLAGTLLYIGALLMTAVVFFPNLLYPLIVAEIILFAAILVLYSRHIFKKGRDTN